MNYYAFPGLKWQPTIPARNIDELLLEFCELAQIKPEYLRKRSRLRDVVRHRQTFCYLARKQTLCSLKEIGRFLGFDHTTVMYAIQAVEADLQTNADYREWFNNRMPFSRTVCPIPPPLPDKVPDTFKAKPMPAPKPAPDPPTVPFIRPLPVLPTSERIMLKYNV